MYDKTGARGPFLGTTPNFQLPTKKALGPIRSAVLLSQGMPVASNMDTTSWNPRKPFDLRERLFDFGLLIVRLSQFLHTCGPVAVALSYQLLKCGTSAGANYEEADDGSSVSGSSASRELRLGSWRLELEINHSSAIYPYR